jgi:hypothetical protein
MAMSVSVHLYSFCPKSHQLKLKGSCHSYLSHILFLSLSTRFFYHFQGFLERYLG